MNPRGRGRTYLDFELKSVKLALQCRDLSLGRLALELDLRQRRLEQHMIFPSLQPFNNVNLVLCLQQAKNAVKWYTAMGTR